MSEAEFRIESVQAVVTITLTKPQVGNALSGDAAAALADVFDAISYGSGDVRAVLIRAEGRHFCTGADLSGPPRHERPVNGHMVRGLARSHHRLVASVFDCPVPTVAAVQGAAIGFGLHLALATDFIVAGEGATFAEPFSDRGFNVDSGGSWLLPRFIGLSRAKQMLYFAERIGAATAAAWGLVAEVTADDQLDATARTRVERLASRPTQALAATKRLLHDGGAITLDQAMHAESMAVELTVRSDDFKEGMKAFMAKRPAEFTGT